MGQIPQPEATNSHLTHELELIRLRGEIDKIDDDLAPLMAQKSQLMSELDFPTLDLREKSIKEGQLRGVLRLIDARWEERRQVSKAIAQEKKDWPVVRDEKREREVFERWLRAFTNINQTEEACRIALKEVLDDSRNIQDVERAKEKAGLPK